MMAERHQCVQYLSRCKTSGCCRRSVSPFAPMHRIRGAGVVDEGRGVFAPQPVSCSSAVCGGPSADDCSWDVGGVGVEDEVIHGAMDVSLSRLGFSDFVRKCLLGMEGGCVAQDKTEQETADRRPFARATFCCSSGPADSAIDSHMCCRKPRCRTCTRRGRGRRRCRRSVYHRASLIPNG